jgi:hypothetical protein
MNGIDLKHNMRTFIKLIMWGENGWSDNVDGAEMQDAAEKLGLIELVEIDSPCESNCACDQIGLEFPLMCYRWTEGMEDG